MVISTEHIPVLLAVKYHLQIADRRIAELEATRDLTKIWLHVDMDAFYAAVETLCDPSLRGKPMAVGSTSMISTANYEVGIDCGWLRLMIGLECISHEAYTSAWLTLFTHSVMSCTLFVFDVA